MILDIFYEKNTEVVVSYLPVWELFFSMHVLSNPEHHPARKRWAKTKEARFPALTGQIRALGGLTNSWTLIIDSDHWPSIRQMEVVEMLAHFRKMNLYQWNDWIRSSGKTMSREERDRILETVRQYYDAVFQREELFLGAFLKRLLLKERDKCKSAGLWTWCRQIHPRLCIGQDTITYQKNREYRFRKEEIETVYLTASTFLSPHLWLYSNHHTLEIVKSILLEETDNAIPQDFTDLLKALGDQTRLQIIRYLLHGVCTTKELAQEMKLSEAAISKHLTILRKAGLLQKARDGYYMKYEFNTGVIDFLPYTFYETMLP